VIPSHFSVYCVVHFIKAYQENFPNYLRMNSWILLGKAI